MPLPNDFQNSYNKEMYANYEKQIVSEAEMLKHISLKLKFKTEQ